MSSEDYQIIRNTIFKAIRSSEKVIYWSDYALDEELFNDAMDEEYLDFVCLKEGEWNNYTFTSCINIIRFLLESKKAFEDKEHLQRFCLMVLKARGFTGGQKGIDISSSMGISILNKSGVTEEDIPFLFGFEIDENLRLLKSIISGGIFDKANTVSESFLIEYFALLLLSLVELKGVYDSTTRYNKKMIKTYLLRHPVTRLTKIGKTVNLGNRYRTLCNMSGAILIKEYIIKKDVELALHKRYKSKRKVGEWFDLSEDDIKDIIQNF